MTRHVAVGPDGGNLLGFLASVGALATLTEAWAGRDVRLSWTFKTVAWRPMFHVQGASTEEDVIEAISRQLADRESAPELTELGDDLTVAPGDFRAFASRAAHAASPEDRRWADFAAAFGCESTADGKIIKDTALRTMSGAGHQHFLRFMRDLAGSTSSDHIERGLFQPWTYDDDRPSMRWDPVDDRRYALRADNPATSTTGPIRTVRGANRLAIEALRCFPTMPSGGQLETTGFMRTPTGGARQWVIRWPIWEPPCSLRTLCSVLANPEILRPQLSPSRLASMGVVEVFASRRQTVGQLRSFLPAEALLGSGIGASGTERSSGRAARE